MLGLFAMLLVLFAIAAVLAYWVSWELENKNTRPSFMVKFWNDFAALFGRGREEAQSPETGPVSA
jgi:hypothetical protein